MPAPLERDRGPSGCPWVGRTANPYHKPEPSHPTPQIGAGDRTRPAEAARDDSPRAKGWQLCLTRDDAMHSRDGSRCPGFDSRAGSPSLRRGGRCPLPLRARVFALSSSQPSLGPVSPLFARARRRSTRLRVSEHDTTQAGHRRSRARARSTDRRPTDPPGSRTRARSRTWVAYLSRPAPRAREKWRDGTETRLRRRESKTRARSGSGHLPPLLRDGDPALESNPGQREPSRGSMA